MSTLAAQRGSAPLRGLTSSLSSLCLKTSSSRTFSTTPAALTKTIALHRIPAFPIPDYPLGPRLIYKQSNGGLYATARIRRGNNISSDHKVKTPRAWRPNIHRKRLWSAALGVWMRPGSRCACCAHPQGGRPSTPTCSSPRRRASATSAPAAGSCAGSSCRRAAVRARFADERARLGVVRPAGVEDEDNTDLVHVLVDGATPGPLSAVSRAIIARRAEAVAADRMAWDVAALQAQGQEFALGEEAELAGDEDVRGAGEQVGGTVEELDAAIEAMEKDEAKRP
ncbi:54S ribosomal protein L24 [Verticillium dahliae VdLs.17]|uniref:54S ribosomal protein L24 n=1 Tax=Verticillium dahliae (strain VdLs.17 / ATCC MYA-4575 / FGSC 10137) TaxID=498257 RepID=G2WTY2_VERDV|nr:54S ribosomal protein L24 [Verticillium dahliae VdLs.17]EGY17573.1 54S ribosomal protein L24 [Verticillium dahliae VdLs.17]